VFETLVEGYGLVEGPRPDGEGVLFSDVLGGGVHRWSPGGVETLLPKRRGIGGLIRHADGGLVVTGRDLLHGDRVVLAAPEGVAGFNDLATDDDGAILVGALRFNPMRGESPAPGEVWRVTPDAAQPLLHGVLWPNGIGVSPAGDVVYVDDFATREVLAYDPDGKNRRVFATSPRGSADGLAVDAEGGVWIALGAGGGVARFGEDGALEDLRDVPADFVASVAFDGEDLLVATAGTLLRTRAGVAGRRVAPARA